MLGEQPIGSATKFDASLQVTRDGVLDPILHPDNVLVGDVLSIEVGDVVAADGIALDGNVKVDESSLTG